MEEKYAKGKKAFYIDIINENIEEDNNDDVKEGKEEEKETQNKSFNEENEKRKRKKIKLIEPKKKELNNVKHEGIIIKKRLIMIYKEECYQREFCLFHNIRILLINGYV